MKTPVKTHRQLLRVMDELSQARVKMELDEEWQSHITDALDMLETFAMEEI